jgi:uncharacterized protein involved in tellurium resistance
MTKSQKPWESKTMMAGVVALLMMISMIAELDLDEGMVTELVEGIIGVVSLLGVFYGRIKAIKKISL